ncbi:diacylglycerol/lipid kinase family protein [Peptococcus simiae]|uniref:diacylglycerol/lipid kinase family protein n=1 Tax=Peptococcus simiae TaxID=1643805 RepID=UPI003980F4CB
MKKLLFVINPAAGRSSLRDNLLSVVKIFSDADYLVTLYITKCAGDGQEHVARSAKEYDIIVCAGGDGTLNEVVNGILLSGWDVPLGYIPAGTTNDFATSHQLSRIPRQAARNIVEGKPFPHDVGEFNGEYFTYVAACGLFSDVSFSTPQALKNAFGRFAYYFEGARKIQEITQEFPLELTVDGKVMTSKYCFLAVANSLSLGGVLQFPEDMVSLSDGVLEVLAVKAPQNPIEFHNLMRAMVEKDYNNDMVRCIHGKEIRVQTDVPLVWTLDGESGGKHTDVTIRVCERQIRLIY